MTGNDITSRPGASPTRGTRRDRQGLRACLACCLVLACRPPVADAADLRAGVSTDYLYNSNFFGEPGGGEAANLVQVGPTLDVVSTGAGRFGYAVSYAGLVQQFLDQEDVDAVEHRLRARVQHDLSRRTRLQLTERFRDVSNLRFSRVDIELGDTALDPNQNRYLRNDLELELRHELSRRLRLEAAATHQLLEFVDTEDRNDSSSLAGAAGLRYRASRRQQFGIGIEVMRQVFEPTPLRSGSTGNFLNLDLGWTWAATRHLEVHASAGPAWIRSSEAPLGTVTQPRFVGGTVGGTVLRADFASCDVDPLLGRPVASRCDPTSADAPGIVADDLGELREFVPTIGPRAGNDEQINLFAELSVEGRWERWSVDGGYRRRQSTTAGDALVSVLDRFAFEVERHPRRSRWSQFVAGSWDRRATLTEATLVDFTVVPGERNAAERETVFTRLDESNDQLTALTLIAGVRNDFSRRFSATLDARFRHTRRPEAGRTGTADQFFVSLSLAYRFAPVRP